MLVRPFEQVRQVRLQAERPHIARIYGNIAFPTSEQ